MRESGILMHITSLPGPYGIGTMGREAYRFVDFLRKAGQHCWQILPLTPTGFGNSPYQSFSAFAGNYYLIDLQMLVEQGLLLRQEVESVSWESRKNRVDFGILYKNRMRILKLAYKRFDQWDRLETFCSRNTFWLPDFVLFQAIKNKKHGLPWYQWEEPLKFRKPEALAMAAEALREETRFFCFVEYLFDCQWKALREYAGRAGIRIIGDVPIYVPYDSADVWSHPELFFLDEALQPVAVAGCPPDYFSRDGQLWGNPLYRWDVHRQQNFSWWLKRLGSAAERYDVVRIDHFRGLESYWSVPYGDTTARNGHWVSGPGMKFVSAVRENMPDMHMIAEDLGFLTEAVYALREASGYPGMKVLQFAFDSREPSDYLPYRYTANTVCYTGTHDNMTTRQWLESAPEETAAYASEYMHLTEQEGMVWGVIRTALSSVAELCIVPMQDYLNLGKEARMNFPGTQSEENWTWRAENEFISDALAEKICRMTELYGR